MVSRMNDARHRCFAGYSRPTSQHRHSHDQSSCNRRCRAVFAIMHPPSGTRCGEFERKLAPSRNSRRIGSLLHSQAACQCCGVWAAGGVGRSWRESGISRRQTPDDRRGHRMVTLDDVLPTARTSQRAVVPNCASLPVSKGSLLWFILMTRSGNPSDVFQGGDWFPLPAASNCRIVVTWSFVKVGIRTRSPSQLARITPEEE